jgi:hypothetical protein
MEASMAKLPNVCAWRHKNGIFYLRYTYLGERRMLSTRTKDLGEAELVRRNAQDSLLNGQDPGIAQDRKERKEAMNNVSLSDVFPELERKHFRDLSLKTSELYRGNYLNLSRCKI